MKRSRLLLLAVASAPMAIHAQSVQVAAVTDANVAVPPPKYQSAYADYVRAEVPALSPDKQWVQGNRQLTDLSTPDVQTGTPAPPAAGKHAEPVKRDKLTPTDPHVGHNAKQKGQ